MNNRQSKDFLFLHLSGLPYFRAFLRAVESAYYQDLDLPSPILDVGCGDGNFATLTFDHNIDVGLDPWHGPIHEAKGYGKYNILVESDGGTMPFPDGYFSSAFSNSVLEHIPHVDLVVRETSRVLKPGAPFVFCVPSQNFLPTLSIGRALDKVGLRPLGNLYRAFFNKISRHHHCDNPSVWQARLEANGFRLERWWHYFSPAAMRVLEWGHYFGLPSLIIRKLTGRWILLPTHTNLYFTEKFVKKYASNEPVPDGTFTFYIARKR